ncbi:Na+/proline, Na+/panthothenate symporter, partial [Pseudomonas amygdali pv. lachrymans]
AILGVVASGVVIDVSGQGANPAAQAFTAAAGNFGLIMFGLVLWAAGISSVIGASYTSMSFITVFSKRITERVRNLATVGFILITVVVYVMWGKPPAALLVFAGGFNGLILPLGLSIFMYVGWRRSDMMDGYHYPRWLLVLGVLTCLLSWYMAFKSAGAIFAFINAA